MEIAKTTLKLTTVFSFKNNILGLWVWGFVGQGFIVHFSPSHSPFLAQISLIPPQIEPGTLRDCVFAEGRMLTSGKKVHLIVRKDKPSQEGLHHVITTDSPVKRVSDIRLKHSVSRL